MSLYPAETARVGSLDALRGLAVLLVMADHFRVPGLHWGFVGVDVFFVLSGYLITKGLLHRSAGPHWYGSFLWRRFARLGPVLGLVLVALIPLGLLCGESVGQVAGCTGLGGLDLMNLSFAESFRCAPAWHVTWSLAAEEQFYLLWPLVLLALTGRCHRAADSGRQRRIGEALAVTVLLFLGSLLWQVHLRATTHVDARVMFAPDARSLVLLLGCATALALELPGELGRRVPAWVLGVLGVLSVVLPGHWSTFATCNLAADATAWVTWSVVRAGSRFRLLELRWLQGVGRMSYSYYLWHMVVAMVLSQLIGPGAVVPKVALTAVLAAVTHRFVELPAQAWLLAREPFGRVDGRSPVAPATSRSGALIA